DRAASSVVRLDANRCPVARTIIKEAVQIGKVEINPVRSAHDQLVRNLRGKAHTGSNILVAARIEGVPILTDDRKAGRRGRIEVRQRTVRRIDRARVVPTQAIVHRQTRRDLILILSEEAPLVQKEIALQLAANDTSGGRIAGKEVCQRPRGSITLGGVVVGRMKGCVSCAVEVERSTNVALIQQVHVVAAELSTSPKLVFARNKRCRVADHAYIVLAT